MGQYSSNFADHLASFLWTLQPNDAYQADVNVDLNKHWPVSGPADWVALKTVRFLRFWADLLFQVSSTVIGFRKNLRAELFVQTLKRKCSCLVGNS
jgi:hypothetical protein